NGLETPWSEWSTNNTVSYSSLPPGKYVFEVQSNSGFGQNNSELSYSFEIATPFQQTSWFRLLVMLGCILGGVGLQYVIQYRKEKQLKAEEKKRREERAKIKLRTAEDFHDEIGNKLTRINVLTNVLKN